jgi:formylglycine-generating enzyme required for sulfatase activity
MNQEEIQNQIKKLEKEYADLKQALSSMTSNFSNTSILRGILSGAGSAAELILKCVYRKEITLDEKIPAERADEMKRQASEKLMLDELIKNVESKIPLRILTHLRTIQAWRNIGSHDKGVEINETVNSSSLQVVSLAVNELIIWFVSEYLNLDATNFIDNSAEENSIIRNNNADSTEAWKEAYWYAMKDGSISRLDQSKLDFLSKKLNLTEEDKNKVIASFERNETEFVELINEIFKNSAANNLDLEELEHIDFIRQECCISEKEASELLQQKTFNNKIIEKKNKITFEWIRNLIPNAEQTIVVNETKHEVVNESKHEVVKTEIKPNPKENKTTEEPTIVKYVDMGGIEMVFVEGGKFIMRDNSVVGATPHKVELDSFYIGKYPITQAQWMGVMSYNPSFFKNPDCPVDSISWDDCQKFISKLNVKTKKKFRLPTEAQWEFAARGGKLSKGYNYAGSNNINVVAWYDKNSNNKTHPVGLKEPNEIGIYDMSGNVNEWCSDWKGKYRIAAKYNKNPKGPENGEYRVVRGGSWLNSSFVAVRDYRLPNRRYNHMGIRLALSVE